MGVLRLFILYMDDMLLLVPAEYNDVADAFHAVLEAPTEAPLPYIVVPSIQNEASVLLAVSIDMVGLDVVPLDMVATEPHSPSDESYLLY